MSDIYHVKIGDIDFYSIQDDSGEMDSGILITDDKDALSRLSPTGKVPSGYAVFILKKGLEVTLIDTGKGGKMLEHLQTIGIKPVDVKNILLTHSHGDHVGGLVKNDQKVFPNATLWIDAGELTFWKSARNGNYCEQCVKLYGEPKILTPDERTATIFPELVSVPLHGHTPGQTGFLLSSDSVKLLVVADLLHNGAVQFARPDISIRYDNNPKQAAEIRRKTLRRAAEEKLLIAASHLPFPSIGRITDTDNGFRYTPIIEKPMPGKQVAQTINLPAMTRRFPKQLSQAESKALTPEQREVAAQERNRIAVEEVRSPEPLSKTETRTVPYLLFLPGDYDVKSGKQWPLLLYLHGAGSRGDDINIVKRSGVSKLLADPKKAKDWPFITVSPQCPAGYSWSPYQIGMLLDDLEKNYSIDNSRVYVTGVSMGGRGTWSMLYHFPKRFAAGVPICGRADTAAAETVVDIPVWVFHGDKDQTVKVEHSIDMVEAIKAKGGKKAELTIYPGLGHSIAGETYNNPEVFRWMLKQSRPE